MSKTRWEWLYLDVTFPVVLFCACAFAFLLEAILEEALERYSGRDFGVCAVIGVLEASQAV